MKIKNLSIGNQLIIGFAIMLAFVIVLGIVSNHQANKIHLQTEDIYHHPLQLRRTISNIKIDILNMR
ncbi:MAG: MCP four helix bundle domain-containing protein [Bacteroidota bacterium]|nr:MCP four helix bundle domain-containing protein [Bacteroidota bacterium]